MSYIQDSPVAFLDTFRSFAVQCVLGSVSYRVRQVFASLGANSILVFIRASLDFESVVGLCQNEEICLLVLKKRFQKLIFDFKFKFQ